MVWQNPQSLSYQPIIYSSWYSLSSLIFIIHKLCDFKHRCNFEAFYICGIYRSRAMGLMHSDRSISRKYARVRRTKENCGLFLPRESGNADPCRYSRRGLNKHWPVNATVNAIYSQPWKSTPIVFCVSDLSKKQKNALYHKIIYTCISMKLLSIYFRTRKIEAFNWQTSWYRIIVHQKLQKFVIFSTPTS